jgi:NAD(P)-dependent dehydrogenase (short-subunit alcohol dehydrogenase family)
MFALELDRHSQAQGWGIVSNAAHPGTALTGLYGGPAELTIYRPARGQAAAGRLWNVSERLAGVEFATSRA